MAIKLSGGKVYDPANKVSGEVRDIYVEDGKIVGAPADGRVAQDYDVKGRVVMAGAIDPHTHIGGGKMTIARMMIPEDHMKDEVKRTAQATTLSNEEDGFAVAIERYVFGD